MVLLDRINGTIASQAIKVPVRVATDASIALQGLQTIDGVVLETGDRVLVKDQTNMVENGIYVADADAWRRAPDFDGIYDVRSGTQVRVTGNVGAGRRTYELLTTDPVIGTSEIAFAEILSGGGGGGTAVNTEVVIESPEGTAFTREPNQGAWLDTQKTFPIKIFQGGVIVASATAQVNLNTGTGILSGTITSGNVDISITFPINDDQNIVMQVRHVPTQATRTLSIITVQGGDRGAAGTGVTVYQILPLDGTAIRNSSGTLRFQLQQLSGGVVSDVTSGTIQIFDANDNPLGYAPTRDSDDISGSEILTAKDGAGGEELDTIAIVDVLDGIGTDAVYGAISASNGIGSVKAPNDGPWTPAGNVTDLTVEFFQDGSVISSEIVRVTRNDSNGNLSAAVLNDHPDIESAIFGNNSAALTVAFVHSPSGARVSEAVRTSQGGAQGASAEAFQILPLNGTIIRNGTGSLSFQLKRLIGGTISDVSSGTIQIFDESNNPLGYNPTRTPAQINGSEILTAKDGPSGTPLDTIALVDVVDGVGTDLIFGAITASNGLGSVQAPDDGAWSPASNITDLTVEFFQGGIQIALEVVRVTRNDGNGNLTAAVTNNNADITVSFNGLDSPALTVEFVHVSGAVVSESIRTSRGGSQGPSAEAYQILPLSGTAIRNGTGSLPLQLQRIFGSAITNVNSGSVQIYDESNNPLGYAPTRTAAQINGSEVLTAKDGAGGPALDTIALVDVLDGLGTDAVYGSITASNGIGSVQAPNGGPWSPSVNTTDLTVTFYQGASVIDTETVRVTRNDSNGTLTAVRTVNGNNTTFTTDGEGTNALTVEFLHTSGVRVSESVRTSQGGADGANQIYGFVTSSNGLASSRAPNGGAWTPASNITDLTCQFFAGGLLVATEVVRVIRNNADGTFTASLQSGDPDVTFVVAGSGQTALTVRFNHTPSGATVSERVVSAQGGDLGPPGADAEFTYTCGDSVQLAYAPTVRATSSTTFARIKRFQLNGTGDVRIRYQLQGGNLDTGQVEFRQGSTVLPFVIAGADGDGNVISTTSFTNRQHCVTLDNETDTLDMWVRIDTAGTHSYREVEVLAGAVGGESVVQD